MRSPGRVLALTALVSFAAFAVSSLEGAIASDRADPAMVEVRLDDPAVAPHLAPDVAPHVAPGRAAASAKDSIVEARPQRGIRRCLAAVPLRVALGRLLLPLTTPGELQAAATAGARGAIGGVVLLGAPTEAQLEVLGAAADAGFDLLVASDEEGGSVQRLGHLLGRLPSARTMAGMEPAALTRRIRAYAEGMRGLGVDVAFAPVVDVGGGPGIGDRAFSHRPRTVVRAAEAVMTGFVRGGVVPTLKHFPGHGRASEDSHVGFARTPPLAELRRTDLVPYEALLDTTDLVMVGHLLVPGLTRGVPASLSPAAIDGLLRDEMGFDGVVVTDALNMAAIARRWNDREATLLALQAGADLVILEGPGRAVAVTRHLRAAVASGELRRGRVDRSLGRVLALGGIDPCDLADRARHR